MLTQRPMSPSLLPSQPRRTKLLSPLEVTIALLPTFAPHIPSSTSYLPLHPNTDSAEKPADDSDVEMKDAPDATTTASFEEAPKEDKTEQAEASAPAAAGGDDAAAAAATTNASKNKTPARRKSTAGADGAKGKKLNKKGSRAAILHIDAKPGDHYFIKLKGFPQWPCVICDESMLPHALIKTRPVSAARPDGEYREDYADGGKRAPDRSFPIMYLATNEL